MTTVTNCHFSGATSSKKAIVVENTSVGPFSSGTLNIAYNTCLGKGNFFLYNNWPEESSQISLNIVHNSIAKTGSSAIVLYPAGSSNSVFSKFSSVTIRDNAITNSGKLAVIVDYSYGEYTGNGVPDNGAFLVDTNLAYQNSPGTGNTVDPTGNYGFSSGSPAGTTLAMYNLTNNLVLDPLWADDMHANNNFEFLFGSPLEYAATDGTNIGYWQGHPIPEPASLTVLIAGMGVTAIKLRRRR